MTLSCNNCFNTEGVVRRGRSFMEYITVWCPACLKSSVIRKPMPPEYWGEEE